MACWAWADGGLPAAGGVSVVLCPAADGGGVPCGGMQAKKLEEIRSEAQAELGILDVLPVPGLGAELPGVLPVLTQTRPAEEELFPAFKSNDASWQAAKRAGNSGEGGKFSALLGDFVPIVEAGAAATAAAGPAPRCATTCMMDHGGAAILPRRDPPRARISPAVYRLHTLLLHRPAQTSALHLCWLRADKDGRHIWSAGAPCSSMDLVYVLLPVSLHACLLPQGAAYRPDSGAARVVSEELV